MIFKIYQRVVMQCNFEGTLGYIYFGLVGQKVKESFYFENLSWRKLREFCYRIINVKCICHHLHLPFKMDPLEPIYTC
jgi:hypothetical protein